MNSGLTEIGEIYYMKRPNLLQRIFKPKLDLNKLGNYKSFTNGRTIYEQLEKVDEEILEFQMEVALDNNERQISEGLDVITAMYNYLSMLGLSEYEFNQHIQKLNNYKRSGKYGN